MRLKDDVTIFPFAPYTILEADGCVHYQKFGHFRGKVGS